MAQENVGLPARIENDARMALLENPTLARRVALLMS